MGERSNKYLSEEIAKRTFNVHRKSEKIKEDISNNEEESIVKEELMISDDSDIEILTNTRPKNVKNRKNENKLKRSRTLKKKAIHSKLGKLSNKREPVVKEEMVIINLSDSSDNEEGISNSVKLTNTTNIYSEVQNNILDLLDIQSDDAESNLINVSQESCVKMDLDLQSDEEYVMFDFSNFSADDVIKAVQNNKVLVESVPKTNTVDKSSPKFISSKTLVKKKKAILDAEEKTNYVKVEPLPKKSVRNKTVNTTVPTFDSDTLNTLVLLSCRTCGTTEPISCLRMDNRCDLCDRKFMFQCGKCTALFSNLSMIYTHLAKYHSQQGNDNQTINEYLNLKEDPDFFSDVAQDVNDLKCRKCGLQYKVLPSLERHELICRMEPNLRCKYCFVRMSFKRQLRMHMINKHKQEFKMEDLEDILNNIVQNGNKLKRIENVYMGYCTECQKKTLLTRSSTQTQCETCQTTLIYECGYRYCLRAFVSMRQLVRHVNRTHLEAQLRHPPDPEQETEHQVNSNGGIYLCSDCGHLASSITDLADHVIETHFSDRPQEYRCHKCRKKFMHRRTLKRHQLLVCKKSLANYFCAHCRFHAIKKETFKDHLRNCHNHLFNSKQLHCDKCGIVWADVYQLNEHVGRCSGVCRIEKMKISIKSRKRKWNRN